MTYQDHEAAWLTAVADVTGYDAYTLDTIPSALPALYTIVSVTRRRPDSTRMCGGRPTLAWRLTTEPVGEQRSDVQMLRGEIARLSDQILPAIAATALEPDGEADEPDLNEKYGRWQAFDSWTYYAPNRF